MSAAATALQATPILDVACIGKRYGGIVAVEDVLFQVRRGIATGLIGPNGAGKTTIFDLLTGFQRADKGTISFEGRLITNLAAHKISRLGMGRTFQSVRGFAKLSVIENLRIAEGYSASAVVSSGEADERIARALALVEMNEHAQKLVGSLSYGQRKLVELAMVLVQQPKLILLDEPVAGVNPGLAERLGEILSRLVASGVSLLLVEHNISFVTRLCTHVVVMAAARILTAGTPDEIMKNPQVLEAFLGSDR